MITVNTGICPIGVIRRVLKLQLGNVIALKVGQASSPDIIMTSGDVCPTYCFELKMDFSEKRSRASGAGAFPIWSLGTRGTRECPPALEH